MFAGYLFLQFKDDREIRQINPSQTLINLQYYMGLNVFWTQRKHISDHYVTFNGHRTVTSRSSSHHPNKGREILPKIQESFHLKLTLCIECVIRNIIILRYPRCTKSSTTQLHIFLTVLEEMLIEILIETNVSTIKGP